MGLVFEDLIRRFNESANETAGDHFTPREVIRLMVDLLMEPDGDMLTNGSPIVTICDPACGTGGMLSEGQNWIREHNENAIVKVFGQDYNPRSYAVAASDLLIKGHKDSRITKGNTLTDPPFDDIDGFDYLLAKLRDEKDDGIGKVGYEINFNREFFRYEKPRSLKEIDKELAAVEGRILKMLQEVTE